MSRVFVSPLATPFHSLVPIFPIPSRYISIFRAPPPRYFSPSLRMEDELVVFCAPQHPLARRGGADLERLTREAWILREQGSGTRLTFDQAMRHHPRPLNIRLELEHTEAIKRAVESGLGIGCISRLALRDAFRRGSLVPVETPGLDLRRQFYFIWHKQKYQTATMREFLDLCRSETAGISRSDEIVLPLIP